MKAIWNKGNHGLIFNAFSFGFFQILPYVWTNTKFYHKYYRNSNSTRSERIKSEGDIKITKGKNSITVGKKCTLISDSVNDNEAEATMLTQVIEHDHNEDTRKCVFSRKLFQNTKYILFKWSYNENDLL